MGRKFEETDGDYGFCMSSNSIHDFQQGERYQCVWNTLFMKKTLKLHLSCHSLFILCNLRKQLIFSEAVHVRQSNTQSQSSEMSFLLCPSARGMEGGTASGSVADTRSVTASHALKASPASDSSSAASSTASLTRARSINGCTLITDVSIISLYNVIIGHGCVNKTVSLWKLLE